MRDHAIRLIKDRAIDFEPARGLIESRPYSAGRDASGGLRLMLNTARMHRGRAR
jgi:hypothetical protein